MITFLAFIIFLSVLTIYLLSKFFISIHLTPSYISTLFFKIAFIDLQNLTGLKTAVSLTFIPYLHGK